ncbi:MAG: CarD family transcriptional regulator [Clostridia bacterium]|nr:CarD family transcriptional regulator [Clostridia bacterium]MBR3460784.1 CarD family transcriptional regulator [Clostridia bacterium]MBR5713439.1 CarD family transcriptional regulator [Clostridia bacterium]MBR5717479.1 CarD family transcriptional regulator [Clostridia bacterium]
MFTIGDLVCYPMHGVGTVERIVSQTVLGATADYYSLRFGNGKVTALVPVLSAESIGLRSLIAPNECDDVILYMKKPGNRGSDNWNQRYRENMDKMRSGGIYDLADVVKCLSLREMEKGLSSGERKMLATAKMIILTELATVLNMDPAEIEKKIS